MLRLVTVAPGAVPASSHGVPLVQFTSIVDVASISKPE